MYAGFIRRCAAWFLDGIFVFIAQLLLGIITGLSQTPEWMAQLVNLAFVIFYYVYLESSSWQGTLGKKIIGIKVTDKNGQRISMWRSFFRRFSMLFSNLTLGIGYLMCIWTKNRQCLHDMVSGCFVVAEVPLAEDPRPSNPPVWVWILGLVGPLLGFTLFFGIIAAVALPQYMISVEKIRAAESYKIMNQIARSSERHLLETAQWPQDFGQLDMQIPGTFTDSQKRTFKTDTYVFSMQGKYPQPLVIRAQRANNGSTAQDMFNYTLVTTMASGGKLSRTCQPQDNRICNAIIQRLEQI